jgi:uncharacterized coiled-coil protein SlyX
MNAYELADELDACFTKADWEYVNDAVTMLRQQADRIAHLEMLVANRNEIIDKLDLTTPQIKELSDEENNLKWWISSFEHLKALGGGINDEMETKLKEMKEKLKKANEK